MSPARPLAFLLDHAVDAAALGVLHRRGWAAYTMSDLGAHDVADETVAILADERNAVAVTVDVEFSQWRRRSLIGRHLRLRCPDPDVVDVLEARIDEVATTLMHNDHVYVQLSRTTTKVEYPKWD